MDIITVELLGETSLLRRSANKHLNNDKFLQKKGYSIKIDHFDSGCCLHFKLFLTLITDELLIVPAK